MRCATCHIGLLPGHPRAVLCDEVQQIVWGPAGGEPEVEIASALWLASYCPGKCADSGLEHHLLMVDADKADEKVKPAEKCGICGDSFRTSDRHHSLALSIESGDEDAPVVSDDETQYPARFCQKCMPPAKDFGRYRIN